MSPLGFSEHYQIIRVCHVNGLSKKTYLLPDYLNSRICRYCLKDANEVAFSDDSHIVSEFLGNRHLLSLSECNDCNKFFSENYEKHFANFLGGLRTLFGTEGKKKPGKGTRVPSFKQPGLAIRAKNQNLKVALDSDAKLVEVDAERKLLRFNLKRDKYIPYAVYKCLVKYAYAFLPPLAYETLNSTRGFLLNPICSNIGAFFSAQCLRYYLKENTPGVSVYLFSKVTNLTTIPQFIFLIRYYHIVYQIHLPNTEYDPEQLQMYPIFLPNSHHAESVALSSKQVIANQNFGFVMGYSHSTGFGGTNNKLFKKLATGIKKKFVFEDAQW